MMGGLCVGALKRTRGEVAGGDSVGDVPRFGAVAYGMHFDFRKSVGERGVRQHVQRFDEGVAGDGELDARLAREADFAASCRSDVGMRPYAHAACEQYGFHKRSHPVRLPFSELAHIVGRYHRHSFAFGHQAQRNVDCLSVRACDCHVLPDIGGKDIGDRDDARAFGGGEAERVARAAYCDNDRVGTLLLNEGGIHLATGNHLDARKLELAGKVGAQVLEVLVRPLYGVREVEQSSNGRAFLVEQIGRASCRERVFE